MQGELVINAEKIYSDRGFLALNNPQESTLTIRDKNGDCLHICGTNDWGYLATELLKPILNAGDKLYMEVSAEISRLNPEVVLVGTNEFRLLDIIHTVRDSEYGISVIKGIPIVKGNFAKGIKYLGRKETEDYLPF